MFTWWRNESPKVLCIGDTLSTAKLAAAVSILPTLSWSKTDGHTGYLLLSRGGHVHKFLRPFMAFRRFSKCQLTRPQRPKSANAHWITALATACWTKSLWERLHYYKFKIHLDYPLLPLPRKYDALLVRLFWEAGYRGQQLQTLNRCRLALKLIFLSDIATACGRFINIALVLHPAPQAKSVSSFVFPNERPSQHDWELWLELWTQCP